MSAVRQPLAFPHEMSTEAFLAWDPGDGWPWQLVDGEPRAMAPTNRTHRAIQGELGALIRNDLRVRRPGCSMIANPGIVPRVFGHMNVRMPDLAVTSSPYVDEQATLSDAVLVIEILSPSNVSETRSNVWAYTTTPSV